MVNPGSVGQPRDNDPRAAFLLYDTDAALVTFYRVPYNIQGAQEKIFAAGLPERLAIGWRKAVDPEIPLRKTRASPRDERNQSQTLTAARVVIPAPPHMA